MFEFYRNLEKALEKIQSHEKESNHGIIFDGVKRIIKNFGEVFFPPKKH